jgi:hypothetical protein
MSFSQHRRRSVLALPGKSSGNYSTLFFKTYASPPKLRCSLLALQRRPTRALHNLWDRRLIHLVYSDYFALSEGRGATYDVYVVDYGRFVSMRPNTVGEKVFRAGIGVLRALGASLGGIGPPVPAVGPGWEKALQQAEVADIFVNLMAGVEEVQADIGPFLEDVSRVVADRLLP